MVRISPRSLLCLSFLILPLLARANSPPPAESPSADTDLICSSTDLTDCYPRVFQPTPDFQTIKEGQDIPPGLHVRLNIYTGEREARLNIPMEAEEVSLEGLPTEQSVVTVEQPEVINPDPEKPALRDQVPMKPPPYENAGKIPVLGPDAGDEISTFEKAKIIVAMEGQAFDQELDNLRDLSNDIRWGVETVKYGPLLETLVCHTLGVGGKLPANENGRDQKAASILGHAVQNNPSALKEVGESWKLVVYPSCAAKEGKGDLVSALRNRLGREKNPAALKAKVTAISNLLREPHIREQFLSKGGMELLLAIFLKNGPQWDGVKKKVADLAMDNFLDENMGAQLGIWPRTPVGEKKICESKGSMLGEGCWEHHVETFAKENKGQKWTKDFVSALKEQRPKGGASVKHEEL